MRIAVIGGTGFVGSHISRALVADGHELSLLVREGSEDKIPVADLYRHVAGSLESAASLDATIAGCDTVIYCVGILRELPRNGITFKATQLDGVVRTVESAIKHQVNRFLLMSANGVKFPGTPYQETKKRAEDVALESGLSATVFRPSVIFGDPHGRMEFATQLYRDLVKFPLPAPGFFTGNRPAEGQILMSPVHVFDVADAFVRSLEDQATIGQVLELGGPEAFSWTEMVQQVALATGRNKWIVPYPIGLMKFAATLLDWLPFFPVTRDQLTMLAEDNVADSRVLEELIDRPARKFSVENLRYLSE